MFKGVQADFPNKCVLQSLTIAIIIANSADPDEMQQTTKLHFQRFPVYKGFYSPLSDEFNQEMPLGLKLLSLKP